MFKTAWYQKTLASFLSGLLVLSTFFTVGMAAPLRADAVTSVTAGDVNGDGAVDDEDLAALRKCLAEDKSTSSQRAAGDLDGDGVLTAVDFMKLRKLILEREAEQDRYGYNEAGMRTYTAPAENPSDKVGIRVLSRDRVVAQGEDALTFGALTYGYTVEVRSDYAYFWVQLGENLPETLLYSPEGIWSFQIPKDDTGYQPGVFKAAQNTVKARVATADEIREKRNLALNPYDFMYAGEKGVYEAPTEDLINNSVVEEAGDVQTYPHAYANRVTENKLIFMARNAIDGVTKTGFNHNDYPYQSWGCGKNDDAEFVLYFGREVELDALALVLRADFSGSPPHDTYWESVTAEFSDGSQQTLSLQKGGDKQVLDIEPVTTTSVRLKDMVRHEDANSQMWAALIELEAMGVDKASQNPPAVRTYAVPEHGGKELAVKTDRYDSSDIGETMKQVYDYFEENIGVTTIGWKEAVYYLGVSDAYLTTGDLDYYLGCRDTAESFEYKVNGGKLTDFGDDYAISQMYLTLNALSPDADYKLAGTIANADYNMDLGKVDYHWCDALFMSGMVYTELTKLTGDPVYSDTEYKSYKEWYEKLYSPDNDLWYRDLGYVGKTTPSGKPIFWSRGNAWVFAYLARQLSYLKDRDSDMYQRYIADYKKLAVSLKPLQRPDGTWNSCLNDDTYFGGKETTGTAGFFYGYTIGVQLGILDADEYLPVAMKAYDALTGVCMEVPGRIGYMEKEAADPGNYVSEEYSRPLMNSFGTGLFLMGASALARMCEDYETPRLSVPLDSQDRDYSHYYVEPGYYDGAITATASSDDGNKPSGAFDHDVSGAVGTRWSANGMNNWLTGDLGKLVPLYKVNLHPLQGRDYQYTIQVSDDGKRWVTMVDRSKNTEAAAILTDTFEPVYARYVRLNITGAATYDGGFTSIAEMFLYPYTGEDPIHSVDDLYEDPRDDTVYVPTEVTTVYSGDQPAGGYYDGPVTVTATNEQEGNEAPNLFNRVWTDAATGSRWAAYIFPQSATADFGEVLDLKAVTIMVYQGRQYYYQLEVSEDGEEWQTVSLTYDIYETAVNHTFTFADEVKARYLRLTVNGCNPSTYSGTWISINEILVYTAEEPVNPPDPPVPPAEVSTAYSADEPAFGYYTGPVSVTATSQQKDNEAANLFNRVWTDAAAGSRWAACYFPQTATADFGQILELREITMVVYQGRQYYYQLETSEDGADWFTVSKTDSPYLSANNHSFSFSEPLKARYLRVPVTGCNKETYDGDWAGINEILVYTNTPNRITTTYSGDEPAEGYYTGQVSVTATHEQKGNEAANLFNGIWTNAGTGSRWAAYIFPQSATADLGEVLELDAVTMMVVEGRQYYYQLEISEDGESWRSIGRTERPYETAQNHTFTFSAPVKARYIRIIVNGRNPDSYKGDWAGINELLLYPAKRKE